MNKEMRSALIVGAVFLVAVLLALWWVFDTKDQAESKRGSITTLQSEIQTLEEKVGQLQGLADQSQALKNNLDKYVEILPAPEIATEEALIRLVYDKSSTAEFTLDQITVDSKNKAPAARGGRGGRGATPAAFEEVQMRISGVGTFAQFVSFLNLLETDQSFLRVNSFNVNAGRAEGEVNAPLAIQLTISTFRYRAQEKPAPKGKK